MVNAMGGQKGADSVNRDANGCGIGPSDAPHPSRLDPTRSDYGDVIIAHRNAVASGLDGYKDPATGFYVLTAKTLADRGECCTQGCRHCPYLGQDENHGEGNVVDHQEEERSGEHVKRHDDEPEKPHPDPPTSTYGTARTGTKIQQSSSRWRPGVRQVLTLVVLLPTAATAILIGTASSSRWSFRQNAQVVASEATELQGVAKARAQLNEARVPAMAIAFAGQLGINVQALDGLLGADYATSLDTSLAALVANPTFSSTHVLRSDISKFRTMVPEIQAGTVPYAQVRDLSTQFAIDVDNLWYSDYENLQSAVARWQPPGSFEVHVAALRQTYVAFLQGGYEVEGAIYVDEGQGGAAAKTEVIQAVGQFQAATAEFTGHLGPKGQAAWNAIENNAADQTFQGTVQNALNIAVNGGTLPFASDPALAGVAETNGLNFLSDINALVRAASADLHDTAAAQASAATAALAREVVFLLLLAVVSIGGVVIAGQYLSVPLKRLAGAALRVSTGEFDLESLTDSGPREVVATSAAFNDMSSTLKAVEAKTVALATEDLAHPELQVPLPGRTGQALQATVDALATRIRERELQRQELQRAATHDRLTGVFNRSAIFDYLTNDVARRRQAGETVAVLFADMDRLKPLNDIYGHEAGDRAIQATADALVEAAGPCDVVGRLGGDEFLIVLCAEHSLEGDAAAARIRDTVASRSVSARGSVVPLRCSVGVALAQCDSDTDPMELVRKADEAMYAAKKAAHATRDQHMDL